MSTKSCVVTNNNMSKTQYQSVIRIHTRLTMGKTIWEVVNIKNKQKRSWDCSLRNATGQRIVVRQMTFHEAFLIMITQIGLEPIIGQKTRTPYSYISNTRSNRSLGECVRYVC